jgi:glutathione S-transferase
VGVDAQAQLRDRLRREVIVRDRAVAGMRYFERVLQTLPFVAGNQFSMADITVFAGSLFAGDAGDAESDESVALRSSRARVSEMPGVKNRCGQSLDFHDLRRLGLAA